MIFTPTSAGDVRAGRGPRTRDQSGRRAATINVGNEFSTSWTRTIAADFTGRIIRFDVESGTGGNTGTIEIFAYAPVAGSDGG